MKGEKENRSSLYYLFTDNASLGFEHQTNKKYLKMKQEAMRWKPSGEAAKAGKLVRPKMMWQQLKPKGESECELGGSWDSMGANISALSLPTQINSKKKLERITLFN